jgi:arabinogalactan endo-1,4-beta-galactosidase
MDFIKGMDISSYQEMLDKGYKYYDENGKEVDVLDYAVDKGFNYARIRIWNEPDNVPLSGGYCSLEHTINLAKKIYDLGIPYLLDFHYSDWWADPGNQNKPAKWKGLHGVDLEDAVYEYTKSVLNELSLRGISPSMVQVGNEIRCGMLWPDGSSDNYKTLANLINAGIKGVRDSNGGSAIKIMLHLDQGGRYHYFEKWFDEIIQNGVTDFDIIGLSYYPFWHGTYRDLDETMNKLSNRYDKDLIVAEVAYAYRLGADKLFGKGQERLGGFAASAEGQYKSLEIISGIIAGTNNSRGKGFFYWEPFIRDDNSESWGYCMGIVDENGQPLKAFTHMKTDFPTDVTKARKMYQEFNYSEDINVPVTGNNVLQNVMFEKGLENWNYSNPENVSYVIDSEHNSFLFESNGNVKFELSQNIEIEQTGKYIMAVEYKGDNTTGVCIKPFIKGKDYRKEINIYPSDKMWTRGTIEIELAEATEIIVGIEIDSPQIKGEIRNIGFYQQ